MTRESDQDEASIKLTKADIDLITEQLLTAYAVRGEMDNITYYELHSKLFCGYFQLAHMEAVRQIEREERR